MQPTPTRITDAIRTILTYIGEDPLREGLRETPERVMRSYKELFAGYKQDPKDLFKVFVDGACDEMVVVRNINFTSWCEHHMMSFSGVAHIGYLPDGKVIGLSKIARLLDIFAKRLQIQERLTQQVVQAIMEGLRPKGAGCIIEASHGCMACRGVQKATAVAVTSALAGAFKDDLNTRGEFLRLIKE